MSKRKGREKTHNQLPQLELDSIFPGLS